MNIAICDDEAKAAADLQNIVYLCCKNLCALCSVDIYPTGEALLNNFNPGYYNLVFLDIYMNGALGTEIAELVAKADPSCRIIFTTVSLNHALDGFRVNAVHYLIKPLTYEMVYEAINRCRDTFIQSGLYIEVKKYGSATKVLLKDILYIEVYSNNCHIHTETEVIETRMPLNEIEGNISKQTNKHPFLRSHRSYLVNMQHITRLEQDHFIMENGDKVLIRKVGKKAIQQVYLNYIFTQTSEGIK